MHGTGGGRRVEDCHRPLEIGSSSDKAGAAGSGKAGGAGSDKAQVHERADCRGENEPSLHKQSSIGIK